MNFGSGVGLNLSKSGVSPSHRTKGGSVSTKGFSIRSGIPGLSYRGSWGKSGDGAMIGLMVVMAIAAVNVAIVLAYVAFRVLVAILALLFNAGWFLVASVVNGFGWVVDRLANRPPRTPQE